MSGEKPRFQLQHEKRLELTVEQLGELIRDYLRMTGQASDQELACSRIEPLMQADNYYDDPTFRGLTLFIDMSAVKQQGFR